MTDTTNGYEALANKPERLTIGGREVSVHEVTMRTFGEFTVCCAPFLKEFEAGGRLADKVDNETGDVTPPEEFALFKVLSDNADAFMRAAELVTNQPKSFYEGLRPDEFYKVASKIVEVNGNFFVNALAPILVNLAKTLGEIGLTRSSS